MTSEVWEAFTSGNEGQPSEVMFDSDDSIVDLGSSINIE
jgi:hypothetical protein